MCQHTLSPTNINADHVWGSLYHIDINDIITVRVSLTR